MAQVVLKDVVKAYGSVYAVNHVSLTVEDGEFVALVGPSGCGKTTTLNLVAGLIPITSGDIVIGVNQRPVSKLADLRDLLSGAGAQPLVLTLLRGKAAYTLQVN